MGNKGQGSFFEVTDLRVQVQSSNKYAYSVLH